jgi:chromate transport protein ChrA
MSLYMYTILPTLSAWMFYAIWRFRLWKKSISTVTIVLTYIISAVLFYNGYIDIALIVITMAVVWLIFRAMLRAEIDTITTNQYSGKDRRNDRNNQR